MLACYLCLSSEVGSEEPAKTEWTQPGALRRGPRLSPLRPPEAVALCTRLRKVPLQGLRTAEVQRVRI